ncbi:MAG: hypothetical protein KBT03_11290 [Bacteroidales bacterium]|nr:hypothetical protein [Candidatus Scybalousia scybalohippi]
MKKVKNVTIGADPELFIINTKTNEVVSAIGIIPGEKGKPFTDGMPKGFGVELDCILGEFNIPPCTEINEFVESIKYMKNWIRNWVKNVNPDLDICCKASMNVPASQLKDPKASEIGCMPDFNAYTKKANEKPEGYADNQRVAGFHIHIGYDQPDIKTNLQLIKFFDLCCGVPSILYDRDTFRRTLYGQAGSFRNPKYGVEARTLSSFMLNDEYLPMIFKQTQLAIDMVNDGMPLPDGDLVQKCINTSNETLARHLINLYNITF